MFRFVKVLCFVKTALNELKTIPSHEICNHALDTWPKLNTLEMFWLRQGVHMNSNIHLIGPVSGQSAALSEFLSEFIANRISENRTLLVVLGRWTTFSVRFVKIIIVKWFIVICLELYSKIIELLYVERNISWNLDELAITVSLCLSLILAYWRWYLNLFYKHREMYRRRSYRYLFHLRKGANHWKGL